MPNEEWLPLPNSVIFTWDWPYLRRDILVKDTDGNVHDPVKVTEMPDAERPAVTLESYQLREKLDV